MIPSDDPQSQQDCSRGDLPSPRFGFSPARDTIFSLNKQLNHPQRTDGH